VVAEMKNLSTLVVFRSIILAALLDKVLAKAVCTLVGMKCEHERLG